MSGCNGVEDKQWGFSTRRGSVQTGDSNGGSIVPAGGQAPTPAPNGRATLIGGIISCLIGGILTGFLPVVGCMLVAYGLVFVCSGRGLGYALGTLVATAAVVTATAFFAGTVYVPDAIIAALLAFACAYSMVRKRLTPTVGFLVVVGGTLGLIASSTIYLSQAGSSIQEVIQQVINQYLEVAALQSAAMVSAVHAVGDYCLQYWPSLYLLTAIAFFGFAYLGVRVAAPKANPKVELPDFTQYDVPLWLVGVFVVTLLALSANAVNPTLDDVVTIVCDNLLVALRIALALQGLAIVAWVAKSKKAATPMKVAAYVAAVFLEVELYFMAILGFVDVWANFRHLARGVGKTTIQEDDGQDNGSV
ncbi:MAG: DUF2232 domain-containing protein [Tractidigestivibacter sp.]|jgi:uncharacterized protein YybS (DUF2232 family)|uniref:DUF2232 domain-containing protein n=1 Tax=Tractidigestivibacter sp. TaxID=2847320 RepID=UPI003D908F59